MTRIPLVFFGLVCCVQTSCSAVDKVSTDSAGRTPGDVVADFVDASQRGDGALEDIGPFITEESRLSLARIEKSSPAVKLVLDPIAGALSDIVCEVDGERYEGNVAQVSVVLRKRFETEATEGSFSLRKERGEWRIFRVGVGPEYFRDYEKLDAAMVELLEALVEKATLIARDATGSEDGGEANAVFGLFMFVLPMIEEIREILGDDLPPAVREKTERDLEAALVVLTEKGLLKKEGEEDTGVGLEAEPVPIFPDPAE